MAIQLNVAEAHASAERQVLPLDASRLAPRDPWIGLVHDAIGRALDVCIVEGDASLGRIAEYRRELRACDDWLGRNGDATLVAASAEDLSDHLLKLIHEGLTIERAETVLGALRFFFGYLHEMGFRDDDPTADLDLSWID